MKKEILPLIALAIATATATAKDFNLRGKVVDERGRGIAGVVVSNGIDFVRTDRSGAWALQTDTCLSKFIAISTPADYELPKRESIASGYYASTGEMARKGCQHTFKLTRRRHPSDSFCYIAISDPQFRNAEHLQRWNSETVEDLLSVTSEITRQKEVVTVALGDISWDNMSMFTPYAESMNRLPVTSFQCIGNHDFDLRYQALNNMPYGTPAWGEQEFCRNFGPTDYSFNIGKAHFVVMKNINYMGRKQYAEHITEAQLEWLRRDLSYVPASTLVVLNMHAAAWNTLHNSGNILSAKELLEVLKPYNTHVFVGHTHFFQNNRPADNVYEHNIGAACGAWWRSDLGRSGEPNGYMIVDIDSTDLRWHFKPTKGTVQQQMRVYPPGRYASPHGGIVVNVWDADDSTRIEWQEDGNPRGAMERFTDEDADFRNTLAVGAEPTQTAHLFHCKPSPKAKTVTITLTNRFGETYTETVNL